MTYSTRLLPKLLICALLLMPGLHAWADISLDQAVEQAKQRLGGRVISAETRERDGKRVHNVRILTNEGKVRRLRINAEGGRRQHNGRR
ncbi:MAG: ribosome biogenesis GTPase RsgA [gamma proteobacterium symbiont of Ctena orbiculata]|nr:PepSY domain-containing protein [Candidatus Thiodiazotropha taylori]MBT3059219.1 PepSY domain-containing protein [Candidatus Thiodiazotropha sp. (ex Lucina pensylvanica)]MBV2096427.1 PepSY domain-containing protein [Candidatus Thiodiazotropha sp. (ex Codakia orbicularis)]PUB71971.1 MAG: ribosome biogenesis GTPase RsgA [gamma proteobacterium symbiont of Ctena orbiculata]MBT3061612.1 PepSY domain-containing protein [Candidatus Thiodiazotropha sp. (ex Lucina pensylvanica)]